MQQLILAAPGRFIEREVDSPSNATDEALVQISRIGVCGSDFHAFAGRHPAYIYPRVLGHELSGVVVKASENEFGIKVGDRCAIDPYLNCSTCTMCLAGRTNCCERLEVIGVHRDGGMQELLAVPFRLLHSSKTLSLDELALVETLGIGAHAVQRSGAKPGQRALIIGAGPIGLGTALFAQAAGCAVAVAEMNDHRRQFAAQYGWSVVSIATDSMADLVFDATGNSQVMAQSLHSVAPGGKLIFVGLTNDPVELNDGLFHKREITLLASRNSANQFPRIIRMLEAGEIDVKRWISDRLALSELPTEFADLSRRPTLIKAIVGLNHGTTKGTE
jgi:2-desacetyl-2-hydroxyethyl bacteriochlorophyllide A dehydrogenase